jgi:Protein of unknown function (DUF4058)/Protein of unknown function (DUF2934)
MTVTPPSPFPGMDPYLEDPALWPEFHGRLVAAIRQLLLPDLQDRYAVAIGQRRHATKPGAEGYQEDYLEIRQLSDDKFITLVDVVSPANKTTNTGRQAYLETRQNARDRGANLVEIDLLLQGEPTLDYCREGLPKWDYAVTVTPRTHPERHEIYTATLEKRLPRFRLPLAPEDRDRVLDLQAAFTRCYAEGEYFGRIDYCREPGVPLGEEEQRWLDALLQAQNLREPAPAYEDIAMAAYSIWEQEGRPHGRDKEHWYQATARLRRKKGPNPHGGCGPTKP